MGWESRVTPKRITRLPPPPMGPDLNIKASKSNAISTSHLFHFAEDLHCATDTRTEKVRTSA